MRYNRQSVAYQRDALNNLNNKKSNFKLIKNKPVNVLGFAPLQAFMLLIVLISMVSYLIYNKVVLDKVGAQIIQYQKSYEDMLSEKVRLEAYMESKISLKNLDEIAREEGLSPVQDYQIEYVDFQTEDNIEVIKDKNSHFEKIKGFLNLILSYIK